MFSKLPSWKQLESEWPASNPPSPPLQKKKNKQIIDKVEGFQMMQYL